MCDNQYLPTQNLIFRRYARLYFGRWSASAEAAAATAADLARLVARIVRAVERAAAAAEAPESGAPAHASEARCGAAAVLVEAEGEVVQPRAAVAHVLRGAGDGGTRPAGRVRRQRAEAARKTARQQDSTSVAAA